MTNYNLLGVFIETELTGLQADGILGLAPNNQGTKADIFIDWLKREGIIEEKVFSFSFGSAGEKSQIIFGGYDL